VYQTGIELIWACDLSFFLSTYLSFYTIVVYNITMSTDAIKKRRVDGGHHHQGGDSASESTEVDSGVTLAAIMAKMNEMETRNISMQNEMTLLKNENKSLMTRCDSLERSMQILIKERKWEYSAPDIPTSHWIEAGFDQDYIVDMKIYFLDIIQGTTCELRSGRDMRDEWITVGNNDINLILHDDLLLPHWKELANAMQLYRKGKLKLSIVNLQLSTSVIDLLKPVLKNKPLEIIDLQNNSFVHIREGIEFAVEVMESNERMCTFYWTSNTINSMEDARYLVEAVNSHPAINTVRLENCFGNDINGYGILQSLLAGDKNFTYIDLERNNFTQTGGSTAISDYIATNPSLEILRLSDNHLNDDDARLIARALKHNTNLKDVWLCDNNITEVGVKALSKAVYNPESLNSVADCNHTCKVRGIDFGDIPVNLSVSTLKQNRARKIYHLLSLWNREGSNVRHLNLEFGDEEEDTLALVPKVLECVHRYSHECVHQRRHNQVEYLQPLSITYEILRGWKMPELYEPR